VEVTWLGHSTVLLESAGVRVVADPLLRRRIGGLRRVGELPAAATALLAGPRVDAVLISHLHHDHCDLPSLRRLGARQVVVPPGAGDYVAGQGIEGVVELAPGRRLQVGDAVTVTAVPAEHLGRREPWGPTALCVGHLVETATATTWLAGDTGLYDAMQALASFAARGVVDLAMVPVWGWGPSLGPGHLDPARAADAVGRVGAGVAVPVHWGTLHPAGMRRVMGRRLTEPGPLFARLCARAQLVPVGGSITVGGPAGGPSAVRGGSST
jgi:L-ascorbate metabolism protein UlaG (beta-lactamase superfamily)